MHKFLVAFVLVLFQLKSWSQTKPVIKNLVFEGAGMRGIAYCGSITEMESLGLIREIEKVGGTSSGAITSLALSLGYTGEEIQEIITSTNFKKFNDGHYIFIGGINRTNKWFGWYRGLQFEKWLAKLIERKTGDADITFEELISKGYKDLYVTGTCLNKQKLIIFSRQTYPHMKVKDAIRISTAIPMYFEAVFIDKEGKPVRHPKNREGLDVMVDGGIIANFPIQMFDSNGVRNPHTLGFRIDSDEQIKNDREGKSIAPMPVNNFSQYLSAFYNIVIENLNRQPLNPEDWQRTVSISDGNILPRIRKFSREEINILLDNGKQAIRNYLVLTLPIR
jgi:NTE family protein